MPRKQEVDLVGRRLNDKLVTTMACIIGALSAIVWGIVWSRVGDHDLRILTLEKEGSAIITTLKRIESDIVEIKVDLRTQKSSK